MSATDNNRGVWAWAFYDWANSTFATTVMAGFFPLFFKQYWNAGVPATESTFHLGVGSALASLVVLVIAPVLGALADQGRKKVLLTGFMVLGVLCTALLHGVDKGGWLPALTLFVLATIGFSGSLVFSDALIVDVAAPAERDRASAFAYALGYLGGGLLFALNVAMTLKPAWFGLSGTVQAVKLSFVLVAVWWLVFSLPLLARVRERHVGGRAGLLQASGRALRELASTLSSLRQYRMVLLFLLAYWLYIDGVGTIIRMAVDFGLALGFSSKSLIVALLVVQFVGFPAALLFGYLGTRYGTRRAIFLGLAVYIGVTIWGYFLTSVWEFYAMAIAIGLVQGGVQALSRSYYSRLIPQARSAEFFGFYNMLGKFAAVIGPLLMGVTAVLTGSTRLSILSVVILFVLGALLLWRVREPAQA